MFIEIYNYFRDGKVVKAVGDAYVADEKDPGKLKLRFSNCKNIFTMRGRSYDPLCNNCVETRFSNAVTSARPLEIDDTHAFQARANHPWDSADDNA